MLNALVRICLFATILLLSISGNLYSADNEQPPPAKNGNAYQSLDKAYQKVLGQEEKIRKMQKLAAESDEQLQAAFARRLDQAWLDQLSLNLSYAEAVATKDKADKAIVPHRKRAVQTLLGQAKVNETVTSRIRSRFVLPKPDQPLAEQATQYSRVFNIQSILNQAFELQARGIQLGKTFDLNMETQEVALKKQLSEFAMKRSALIDLGKAEVAALREGLSSVPKDADQEAKLAVISKHIKQQADALAPLLVLMNQMGMDKSAYQEQLLSATGELTSDVFEVGVITSLLIGWGETIWNLTIEDGPDLIFKILLFLIIVFIARKLSRIVQRLVESALEKSAFELSELLRRMVVSIVRNIILVLGILIGLSQVGISLGPLLAGLGVVGFVVGFALQETLSNFASGLMILIYRPYDVGDLIEAAGVFGAVSHMSLVNTTIMTLDNQTIVLPNNKIWGDVIKNVTAQVNRRIDMIFGISYTDDIPKTERVLEDILAKHAKVLDTPEPIVRLHELADSSVNFVVRPWVNREDYWEVYWDITREVKMRFDQEEISIPFPQRDVHLYQEAAS